MKRETEMICFGWEGVVFMLRNKSDAKYGSDTVYKQVIVEIPCSVFLPYPVFGIRENELYVLSESFLVKASGKDTC